MKTYKHVTPPSIALALMSWRLAYRREWGVDAIKDGHAEPFRSRDCVILASAHEEHYRILDRISQGDQP